MQSSHSETTECGSQKPPLWKSKSLMVAAIVALIGLVIWLRAPSSPPTGAPGATGPSASFTGQSGGSDSAADSSRAVQSGSPALFRFGVSYIGGFFLGWAFRKSLKIALLLSGAAVVAIAVAGQMGLVDLDWNVIQRHVSHSLAWIKGEVGALKTLLTGYLPSTVAAGAGVFVGMRRG